MQEQASAQQESESAPSEHPAPAPSHTLESETSGGFAVDFGDTASSIKGSDHLLSILILPQVPCNAVSDALSQLEILMHVKMAKATHLHEMHDVCGKV